LFKQEVLLHGGWASLVSGFCTVFGFGIIRVCISIAAQHDVQGLTGVLYDSEQAALK